MTKFRRRLQRIGSSTLVSLPKEWVDVHGLAKNDEVEIETGEGSLSVSVRPGARPAREITISYPLPKGENIAADLTGAYLLGYDSIIVRAKYSIPGEDREEIRGLTRRLVGMEIVEEDSAAISMKFLLDAATLNPQKILKQMGVITLGMYREVLSSMASRDISGLPALANRDIEVNRQYFLLVRLIRSTVLERRPAGAFRLDGIDVLDYRIAANLLEAAGDTIVELAGFIHRTPVPAPDLERIRRAAKTIEDIQTRSIDAFVSNDREAAVEAIQLSRVCQEKLASLKSSLGNRKQITVDRLDLIHLLERIRRDWADVADLVKPVYAA